MPQKYNNHQARVWVTINKCYRVLCYFHSVLFLLRIDKSLSCICRAFVIVAKQKKTKQWDSSLDSSTLSSLCWEGVASLPTPVVSQPHEKHCDRLWSWSEDLWFLNVYGYICTGELLAFCNLFNYSHEFVNIPSDFSFLQDVQLDVILM